MLGVLCRHCRTLRRRIAEDAVFVDSFYLVLASMPEMRRLILQGEKGDELTAQQREQLENELHQPLRFLMDIVAENGKPWKALLNRSQISQSPGSVASALVFIAKENAGSGCRINDLRDKNFSWLEVLDVHFLPFFVDEYRDLEDFQTLRKFRTRWLRDGLP